ncbi:hypothetical protein PV721_12375 [Streptomyces sp. MB09-01]|uniref:hypothetical protein n=1 Tax=Streptomyces sp. MB09-01 TaxID=3028666 RepID=UPI0029B025A0|nr:hypothetical protein [Streptomyces sp. MB09-01]MDX3535156.1 hypothetical protein [Streptomyces sp. MB09-01]
MTNPEPATGLKRFEVSFRAPACRALADWKIQSANADIVETLFENRPQVTQYFIPRDSESPEVIAVQDRVDAHDYVASMSVKRSVEIADTLHLARVPLLRSEVVHRIRLDLPVLSRQSLKAPLALGGDYRIGPWLSQTRSKWELASPFDDAKVFVSVDTQTWHHEDGDVESLFPTVGLEANLVPPVVNGRVVVVAEFLIETLDELGLLDHVPAVGLSKLEEIR